MMQLIQMDVQLPARSQQAMFVLEEHQLALILVLFEEVAFILMQEKIHEKLHEKMDLEQA